MELPIALAASESLADRPQLVWSAFLDAAAVLRQRLWLPPPYRFVIGPHSATDLALARVLQGAGRKVDALPAAGTVGPPLRSTHASSGPAPDLDRHQVTGARLRRFDEHARLGWAAAIVVTDRTAGDAAISLAVAADRHHRRLELREMRVGADPPWISHTNLDRLPAVPRST